MLNGRQPTTTAAVRLKKYWRNQESRFCHLSEKHFLKFNVTVISLAKNEFIHSNQFEAEHSMIYEEA